MLIRGGKRLKHGKNTDLWACVAQSAVVVVVMNLHHVIVTSWGHRVFIFSSDESCTNSFQHAGDLIGSYRKHLETLTHPLESITVCLCAALQLCGSALHFKHNLWLISPASEVCCFHRVGFLASPSALGDAALIKTPSQVKLQLHFYISFYIFMKRVKI